MLQADTRDTFCESSWAKGSLRALKSPSVSAPSVAPCQAPVRVMKCVHSGLGVSLVPGALSRDALLGR